ncbi:MAG: hypothetical protein WCA64_04350 [Gallionella sp.]
MNAMRYSLRWFLIAIVQALLLNACALLQAPTDGSGSIPENIVKSEAKSSHSSKAVNAPLEYDNSFEIKPAGSIQKSGLRVSYSLLVIPDRKSYLLRLSLVFRNLEHRDMIVRPKILLLDASKKALSAYDKDGFVRISTKEATKVPDIYSKTILGRDSNEYISAQSRIDWADAYWLKSRYLIPPHGIAIGVLIFHGTVLNPPVKLTVHSGKRRFIFSTKAPLPVVGK